MMCCVRSRRRGDEDLGRGDQLPAGRMVLADPRLVVAELVEPFDQLHVAVHRQRGVLADPVERRQEDAELHAFVGQCRLRGQGITRRGYAIVACLESARTGARSGAWISPTRPSRRPSARRSASGSPPICRHELCVEDAMDERMASTARLRKAPPVAAKRMTPRVTPAPRMAERIWRSAAPLMEQIIFDEEYSRARAPVLPGYSGLQLFGPTLMYWGSEEQKKHYIPRILERRGHLVPGLLRAGRRLRPRRTADPRRRPRRLLHRQRPEGVDLRRAVRRPHLHACAHRSRSAQAQGHQLSAGRHEDPRYQVRPLVLMNGHRHFNEVFFDNVQVPKQNLVGPQNEGWKVAMTTLGFERGMASGEGIPRRCAGSRRWPCDPIDGRPAWEQGGCASAWPSS